MLRIIAGKFKNRKIDYFESDTIRPTSERIRESIFDIIQFNIKNSIVLDLFAGSGAFAIESISRGAMKAIVCDKDPKALAIISKNMQSLGITNYDLFNLDYSTLLNSKRGAKFDIIFLDPPYEKIDYYNSSLKLIFENNLLTNSGIIVIEKNESTQINIPNGFIIKKHKKYGKKELLILNKD